MERRCGRSKLSDLKAAVGTRSQGCTRCEKFVRGRKGEVGVRVEGAVGGLETQMIIVEDNQTRACVVIA